MKYHSEVAHHPVLSAVTLRHRKVWTPQSKVTFGAAFKTMSDWSLHLAQRESTGDRGVDALRIIAILVRKEGLCLTRHPDTDRSVSQTGREATNHTWRIRIMVSAGGVWCSHACISGRKMARASLDPFQPRLAAVPLPQSIICWACHKQVVSALAVTSLGSASERRAQSLPQHRSPP
jgi:hypothetical protein